MTEKPRKVWSCSSEGRRFPLTATACGVASYFAEPILQKYFAPGSSVEIALALTQAVPFALVLRYLAARLNSPDGVINRQNLHSIRPR